MTVQEALQQVSLVSANFGNAKVYRTILLDWFDFIGGKPGEVVVVDGGSDATMQQIYWDLFNEGKIDKLQLIRPNHPDNHKDICYIQEHAVGAIASKPYLLWFKIDSLPFRKGHENWLAEALELLERKDVFAVGGSFNMNSKHHDAWPGWYFSHKCSENFSIMKRSSFIAAMEEFAGVYISSGFRTINPAAATNQSRYLIERGFEKYMERHGLFAIVKEEDPTWTIFHTNLYDEQLLKAREDSLARRNLDGYMDAGNSQIKPPGVYYGTPEPTWIKKLRIRFGQSPLGPHWRRFKGLLRPQS